MNNRHVPIKLLKEIICHQYGENWVKLLNRHILLNQKLATYRSHISFLSSWLKEHWIPRSFRLCNRYVFVRDTVLESLSVKLMRQEIRGFRFSTANILRDLGVNLRDFAHTFEPVDYDDVIEHSNFFYYLSARKAFETKARKLITLRQRNTASGMTRRVATMVPNRVMDTGIYTFVEFRDSLIVNKTDLEFSSDELDVLALDPNTAIPSSKIVIRNQIVDIEKATLRCDVKAEIINSTANALRNHHVDVKKWAGTSKKLAKRLRDENCLCVNADKGNKTVVMHQCDYDSQMDTKFADTSLYNKLRSNANPFPSVRAKMVAILRPLQKAIGMKFCNVVPSAEHCAMPKPRGLVKIHKVGHPLRIIIPSYTLPTYYVSKLIHRMLWPFVQKLEHRVTTPFNLVRELKTLDVTADTFVCSFDVVALYDNVDADVFLTDLPDLLNSDEDLWREMVPEFDTVAIPDIVDLCSVVLKSSTFEFSGKRYEQIREVPMGNPCSVAVAELYLGSLLKKAVVDVPLSQPQVLRLFIDDVLTVFHRRQHFAPFLDHLNALAPNIEFTCEVESDNCIPFLDILIKRTYDTLETEVYRKPTHSGRYVHWHSNVPQSFHNSVLNTLRNRAQHYSSSAEAVDKELTVIEQTLSKHRYPAHYLHKLRFPVFGPRQKQMGKRATVTYVGTTSLRIANTLRDSGMNVAFRSQNTLRSSLYYSNKAKIDKDDQSNVIYLIVCQCGKEYVGMTSRKLKTRMYKHRHDVASTKTEVSGLTEHLRNSGHQIASYDVIDHGSKWFDLRIKEGIQVAMKKPQLNKYDSFVINDCWVAVL